MISFLVFYYWKQLAVGYVTVRSMCKLELHIFRFGNVSSKGLTKT